MSRPQRPIPGTTPFDGTQARKGYALNKMCFSFNDAANRAEFQKDEDAYCARYGLNAEQRSAIRNRSSVSRLRCTMPGSVKSTAARSRWFNCGSNARNSALIRLISRFV
mgnify:CR=1 FL=1